MSDNRDSRSTDRVREPVQVYLDPADRERLERLREQLGASKSEALRRGLEALEREITDPARHPALRIIGIAGALPAAARPPYDLAREHDRFLADGEEASWGVPRARPKKGGGRRRGG
ncbi:MAG: CopG family transcriptional regulator [Longimicrobiales bacterium]|nr:CopG family transcriptional regulator [Longimicrobiales bacterium]